MYDFKNSDCIIGCPYMFAKRLRREIDINPSLFDVFFSSFKDNIVLEEGKDGYIIAHAPALCEPSLPWSRWFYLPFSPLI